MYFHAMETPYNNTFLKIFTDPNCKPRKKRGEHPTQADALLSQHLKRSPISGLFCKLMGSKMNYEIFFNFRGQKDKKRE
jgi:hypothetical protein